MNTEETAKALGLLPEELQNIRETLGREPNFTELSAYSAMWSEHCSYKNSIVWLKTLPKDGARMLAKAGEENAGLVDLGDGLACVFKIESHNHPSAIEPYQGAATGVGGINRDIFTMGARPVAQLNSLRFGDLGQERNRRLLRGVVRGIGDYGNAFGVPVVGGEVFFDECYSINPLVNAMSVGLVDRDKTASATAHGAGNPVYIVGSRTGKDGIHGASFASKDINEDSADDLPSVQVGDPFQEKLLLEASLEAIATGALIGMQDMGAAGIICSTSEMSAKGGVGMDIYLDRVPTRQEGMQAWEILLSESQERMLLVCENGREAEIEAVFERWDLQCVNIGRVTDTQLLRFYMHGELVAEIPAESLVLGGGAPVYHREYAEPAYREAIRAFDPASISVPGDLQAVMDHLAGHPNLCSKRWVYEQYDRMVGTTHMTAVQPAAAAVVDIRGTDKALVLSVDCNPRYTHADPYTGAAIAVAEAARNVVCAGGDPVAITNCLNFGNPYNPGVYWQFVEAIKGMGDACRAFGTPVTGGNVSFYNQSSFEGPVYPTPVIGMLGLMDDKQQFKTLSFRQAGDLIYLIGRNSDDISGSQYLYSFHGRKDSGTPPFSLEDECSLHALLREMRGRVCLESLQDVSDGGLFMALLECALPGRLGFEVVADQDMRSDAYWFGEAQGRAVLSVDPLEEEMLLRYLKTSALPWCKLGVVTSGAVLVGGQHVQTIEHYAELYENSLGEAMRQDD